MTDEPQEHNSPRETPSARELARRVLFWFLATFMASRVLVYLVMARRIPDLYLYVGGTHVHHLNYGIFLLALVGAWIIFQPSANRGWAATLYGVGLGLTFDEFGMWLHLGGSYWQRASWDAIAVTAALLGLLAYGPALVRYRPRDWAGAGVVLAAAALFFYLLLKSLDHATRRIIPKLQEIEAAFPP